jgi:hypothetical protein
LPGQVTTASRQYGADHQHQATGGEGGAGMFLPALSAWNPPMPASGAAVRPATSEVGRLMRCS